MARHKRIKKECEYQILSGKVTGTMESIEFSSGRIKSVFNVTSAKGNVYKCIYWSWLEVDEGESVTLKGQLKNDVFLVWNLLKNYSL